MKKKLAVIIMALVIISVIVGLNIGFVTLANSDIVPEWLRKILYFARFF